MVYQDDEGMFVPSGQFCDLGGGVRFSTHEEAMTFEKSMAVEKLLHEIEMADQEIDYFNERKTGLINRLRKEFGYGL